MHKYFAKTLFLGKKIKFLPECHSTNEGLLKLVKKPDTQEGFLIYTDHQAKGKGQRGNAWVSQPGKNILCSFLVKPRFLSGKDAYWLNIITGLSVIKAIKDELVNVEVSLKWPNDAYINDRKAAGILIETILDSGSIESAVIGIGLNVNQSYFHLPSATSLLMESGGSYEKEVLMEKLLMAFEGYYLQLKAGNKPAILKEYYDQMRWRGEFHHYRSDNVTFSGEIIGIDDVGKLVVNVNNTKKHFDIKEIEFLY